MIFKTTDNGATIMARLNELAEANVKSFGAVGNGINDDSVSFQAAHDSLPAIGGVILVPEATGYLINTQITCTKPVIWKIGNTAVTGPSTGYLFEFQGNDSGIEGTAGTLLVATEGCSGVIHNNQTMNCHYWNFKIDSNNTTTSKAFFHDGGWYLNAKNITIDFDNVDATSFGLYIQSLQSSDRGTGSGGGAFESQYENVVACNNYINGESAAFSVTTITFINLHFDTLTAVNAQDLTFLQPIGEHFVPGRTFFDLSTVRGMSVLGGDLEGVSSLIYKFTSQCTGLNSIGNTIVGAGNTYLTGLSTSLRSSFFQDDFDYNTPPSDAYTGFINNLTPIGFRNSSYNSYGSFGCHYDGDIFHISNNVKKIDETTGNLIDTNKQGNVISIYQGGEIKIQHASSGTNPRTFDNGLPTYSDNTAAVNAGLTAGSIYKTSAGVVMIVL